MYSLEEIAALRQKCNTLELEGREILEKYTDEELQTICNGIGPTGMPSLLRRFLNRLHPTLEPAALIHDTEFAESDGSEEGFRASNDRFLANGLKSAESCKWYDPRRYVVKLHARRLTAFCRKFGAFAWQLGAMNRNSCSVKE